MEMKLTTAELRVMNVLWREGDVTAKHIYEVLKGKVGWEMNTTYTLIKRCIKKGAVARSEPNFMCHALVTQSEVRKAETEELIEKVYDGRAENLFAALLGRERLSEEQVERLRRIVDEWE